MILTIDSGQNEPKLYNPDDENSMTVGELITKLQQYPADMRVYIEHVGTHYSMYSTINKCNFREVEEWEE